MDSTEVVKEANLTSQPPLRLTEGSEPAEIDRGRSISFLNFVATRTLGP